MHAMTCHDTQAQSMNHLLTAGGQLNHPETKPNSTEREGVYCEMYSVYANLNFAFWPLAQKIYTHLY